MADSTHRGDLETTVAVIMVVMTGITLGTIVAIKVTVVEVTGDQQEIVGRVEMGQTVVAEAIMARLPTIDMANPGM